MFSAIHHFDSDAAKSVIQDAVNAKEGIGIFDGGDKSIFFMLLTILFHSLTLFLFTPFFYPFKLSRLVFTYILPLIPLCIIWDGIVSLTRLYRPMNFYNFLM